MGIFKKLNFGIVQALIILSSELALASDKDWTEVTSIYQIYPRSFKDSDGDGVGDLNGIASKLDYIKNIGVETIWLQPFYKSPMADLGYDVSDYRQIEPMFGTMDDFKRLVEGIHDRGMKVILDMVPNHVSNENEWFKKSENREEPYTDFFIWHDPKGFDSTTKEPLVPNNWLSIFGGTAWQWSDKRQQFYYKQFSTKQPDLNFRNPHVRQAIEDVMRFWLDLEVDGFRIDAIKHLVEAAHLKDEPYMSPEDEKNQVYRKQLHIYTQDQDEDYGATHDWRMVLEEYKQKDNKTRLLCSEAYTSIRNLIRYYGNDTYKNVHFPFYFGLMYLSKEANATTFNFFVHMLIDNMPAHGIANWVLSNHDNPRIANRLNPNFVDSVNMIALLLPGVVTVYYGDEIGMENAPIRKDQGKDPNNRGADSAESRDSYRSPMQWDDTTNAGFTTNNKAWLPVNPDYWFRNVKTQSKDPLSHLNIFKRLMELRKSTVIRDGELETCVLSTWVFMYVRKLEGHSTVVVIVNLGSESEDACAKSCEENLPELMYVHTGSANSAYQPGDKFSVAHTDKSSCSVLRPKAGVVLVENAQSSANQSAHLCSFLALIILTLLLEEYL